jgi:hypothetical protein
MMLTLFGVQTGSIFVDETNKSYSICNYWTPRPMKKFITICLENDKWYIIRSLNCE